MSIITRIHNAIKNDAYGTMKQCTQKERKEQTIAQYVESALFSATGAVGVFTSLVVPKAKSLKIPTAIARAGLFGVGAAAIAIGVDYAIQYNKTYNAFKDKPSGTGFRG